MLGVACGDGKTQGDAGTPGTGGRSVIDAFGTGGDQTSRPRSDASTAGDPIPSCDRFDKFACGAGQDCAIVLRQALDEDTASVYNGCVDRSRGRGLDAPCIPFDVEYTHPDLEDLVFLDPCETGLLCAPDPSIAGLNTCQRTCQSGRYQGFPSKLCGGPGEYCSTAEGNPILEWCVQSAGCDPSDATACGEARGCFLRSGEPGASGQGTVLSECYPTFEPAVADGQPCQYINDCVAGSLCWGPVRVPPASWMDGDALCRPTCVPHDDEDDAGLPDAGAGGDCPPGLTCVPFTESGLGISSIEAPFGQCE